MAHGCSGSRKGYWATNTSPTVSQLLSTCTTRTTLGAYLSGHAAVFGAHTWLCRFVANSQVSKDEFKKVLSHMNSAVSYFGDDMLDDTKVNEIADQIYEECDHEHDGQLSYSGVFVTCCGGGVSYAHIACIRPILRVHGSCCQAPPHRGVRCWPWRSRRKEGQG